MAKQAAREPKDTPAHPIIFFGTEDFSAASLEALIAAGFTVAAAVTKPDTKKGRGRTLVPPTVKVIAEAHNIPVWQPANLDEIIPEITALQAAHALPLAGVLVSFGKIIPQHIIDLFTPGIINVHPSELPRYRGPSPIESAILNGDATTGVSIMQLSARMDAGPVYHFTPHPLNGTETQPELYATLANLGGAALTKVLPGILSGTLQPTSQNEAAATYCQLIQKSDGIIDWQQPANTIERHIRAYNGWPGSRTALHGVDVTITSAHIAEEHSELGAHPLTLPCGNGTFLAIDTLKPAGKKEMTAQAFANGYGHLFKNS